MGTRKTALAAGIGLVLAMFIFAAPAQASSGGDRAADRICGLEPGDGAFSYTKVWGVTCRVANKVASKAFRRFCGEEFQKCSMMPGEFREGMVSAKGWDCEMKVGYEYSRAECEREGGDRFIRESGA